MNNETVPCPHCKDGAPVVADTCEHCGGKGRVPVIRNASDDPPPNGPGGGASN